MVLLINGGAAVALLSFMNNLPKDQIQSTSLSYRKLGSAIPTTPPRSS